MLFQRAERKRTFIKLAITGASGSGKTYSALRLARGLGERVALLDTENGSASLYADLYPFDTAPVSPPYTVQRYLQVIEEAARAGYDVLIIDSLTHAWAGEGGLLAEKEALDSHGKQNSFANWQQITKKHEALKAAILQAPIHVVATMRSKMEYVVEDRGGKQTPRKVGMAPIQRDGMEYEFTTVFDLGSDHTAITSKDRTGLFEGLGHLLTEEHGRRIAEWLASAAPAAPPSPQAVPQPHDPAPERHQAANTHSAPAANGAQGQTLGQALPDMDRKVTNPPPATKPQQDSAAMVCTGAGCGKPITKGQRDISERAFGQALCPACQRQQARGDDPAPATPPATTPAPEDPEQTATAAPSPEQTEARAAAKRARDAAKAEMERRKWPMDDQDEVWRRVNAIIGRDADERSALSAEQWDQVSSGIPKWKPSATPQPSTETAQEPAAA